MKKYTLSIALLLMSLVAHGMSYADLSNATPNASSQKTNPTSIGDITRVNTVELKQVMELIVKGMGNSSLEFYVDNEDNFEFRGFLDEVAEVARVLSVLEDDAKVHIADLDAKWGNGVLNPDAFMTTLYAVMTK